MNNKVYNRDEIKENVMKYFNNDELSTEVWINKYSLKNQDGDIVEKSPIDMHVRMADEFARIEDKYKIEESKINLLSDYGQKREFLTKEKIFNYFDHFKYIIPQGSVMASLGNPYNISSLSNCIVISEIFDSYGGICFADQQLVQLMKRRCGVGLDLSTLRPKDMSVMNAAGTSTGAVSFMDRFSNTTREVAQSGRRGALMITMDVNHIDIEDFINSKQDLKKVTGANISIKLSDEFMQCVKSDIDYTLKFPINSENPKITKIINAKSLWNKIIKAAWNSAEPGLIFWDRHHKYSTSSIYPEYKNISTNPCAEISMGNDSCRLIALNMFSCVNEPFTKKSNFDFKKWYEISYEGQRLNDDLVDLELESIEKILKKIDSDVEPDHVKDVEKRTWKSLYEVGKNGRRTGLGFTALGDTIAALGYNYDSDESLDIVEKIIKTKCEAEFDSSIDMSIERGSFVEFDPEIENKSDFISMLKKELPGIYERMMKHGRRNVSISTSAPTGSLSLLTQTTSGIEPVFMLSYKRRKKVLNDDKFMFVDELGDKWMEFDVFHPKLKMYLDVNKDKKIENSPYFNNDAVNIDWYKRIKMQSVIQKYTTHSISSTLNLASDVTLDTVSDIYFKGWELGLKGVTIYREGSRSGVLVSNENSKTQNNNDIYSDTDVPKRPKNLHCDIHRFKNKGEDWIGIVGLIKNGNKFRPYEIFTGPQESMILPKYVENGEIVKSKENNISRYDLIYKDKDGYSQIYQGINRVFNPEFWNVGKMISAILRHRMPLRNVVDLIDDLKFIDDSISTWKAGVKRTIKKYIKDGDFGKNCPDCGEKMVYENGCEICKHCGHSKCS